MKDVLNDALNDALNDEDRDVWLREALRHAPDADAMPPAPISEAILRQARTAAAAPAAAAASFPASRVAQARWRDLPRFVSTTFEWLARPRVAAGFASVMVATLAGVLWFDRPADVLVPPEPASPSAAEVTAQPRDERARATAPSTPPSPAAAVQQAVEPVPGPSRTPAPAAKAEPRSAARDQSAPAGPVAPPAAKARIAPVESPETDGQKPSPADESVPSITPVPLALPSPAAAPVPAPSPFPAPGPTPATASAASPGPLPMPGPSTDSAPEPAPTRAGSALQRLARPDAAGAREPSASRASAAEPLASFLAEISRAPENWTAAVAGAEARPVGIELQRWLSRLGEETSTHWRAATAADRRDLDATAGEPVLKLAKKRDPDITLTFQIGTGQITLRTPSGSYLATLAPARSTELADTLARAAR